METRAARAAWAGREIDGKFTLIQWLGGSGLGGVFVTELEGPQSAQAAIKLTPADAMGAKAHTDAWAAASALAHPNLLRLLHTGHCAIEGAEMLYAVTELAEENLAAVLAARPLTPQEARETLGPVLDALACLQAHGLVHGHLKPANIMAIDDRLRISADSLHLAGEPGRHFSLPGPYDAPEIAGGPMTPAADLWSLGVTLVEMFTQQPPAWDRAAHPAPAVPASVPESFARIARGCLQPDPRRRLTIAEIRKLLAPEAAAARAPVPVKAAKRNLRLTPLIAVVLLALAVGAVVVLRPHRTETAPVGSQEQPSAAEAPAPPGEGKPLPARATEQPAAGAEAGAAANPETPAAANPAPSAATGPAAPVPATEPAPAASGAPGGAVVARVLPSIPEKAAATIRGSFQSSIRVEVDAQGNVASAAFDTQGPSLYFANLALQAAQRWKFRPAQAAGQPVPSAWILRFRFSRDGTQVAAEQVAP